MLLTSAVLLYSEAERNKSYYYFYHYFHIIFALSKGLRDSNNNQTEVIITLPTKMS
jgi:hypothetical protein